MKIYKKLFIYKDIFNFHSENFCNIDEWSVFGISTFMNLSLIKMSITIILGMDFCAVYRTRTGDPYILYSALPKS